MLRSHAVVLVGVKLGGKLTDKASRVTCLKFILGYRLPSIPTCVCHFLNFATRFHSCTIYERAR